jgi:hypothetical protein
MLKKPASFTPTHHDKGQVDYVMISILIMYLIVPLIQACMTS